MMMMQPTSSACCLVHVYPTLEYNLQHWYNFSISGFRGKKVVSSFVGI